MIEHINIIDAYNEQICALLDLMMMSESSVDISSIKTAAEMTLTMQLELKAEVDQIFKEWQNNKPVVEEICTNYCKYPYTWNEEEEGCELSESGICNKCPLNKL